MAKLLPCPFCGGEAEADGSRVYRMIVSGRVGRAVAIYCLSCDADMARCCEDTPEIDPEVLMADLVDAWNRRAQPTAEKPRAPTSAGSPTLFIIDTEDRSGEAA